MLKEGDQDMEMECVIQPRGIKGSATVDITHAEVPGQNWATGSEALDRNRGTGTKAVGENWILGTETLDQNRVPGTRRQTKQLKDKLREQVKFTLHPVRNNMKYSELDRAFTLEMTNSFFLELYRLKQTCDQSYVSLLDEVITGSSLCNIDRLETRLQNACREVSDKYTELYRTRGPSSRKKWLDKRRQFYLLKSEVNLGSSLPIVTERVIHSDIPPAPPSGHTTVPSDVPPAPPSGHTPVPSDVNLVAPVEDSRVHCKLSAPQIPESLVKLESVTPSCGQFQGKVEPLEFQELQPIKQEVTEEFKVTEPTETASGFDVPMEPVSSIYGPRKGFSISDLYPNIISTSKPKTSAGVYQIPIFTSKPKPVKTCRTSMIQPKPTWHDTLYSWRKPPKTASAKDYINPMVLREIKFKVVPPTKASKKLDYIYRCCPGQANLPDTVFLLQGTNRSLVTLHDAKKSSGSSYVSIVNKVVPEVNLCEGDGLERKFKKVCSKVTRDCKKLCIVESKEHYLSQNTAVSIWRSEVQDSTCIRAGGKTQSWAGNIGESKRANEKGLKGKSRQQSGSKKELAYTKPGDGKHAHYSMVPPKHDRKQLAVAGKRRRVHRGMTSDQDGMGADAMRLEAETNMTVEADEVCIVPKIPGAPSSPLLSSHNIGQSFIDSLIDKTASK